MVVRVLQADSLEHALMAALPLGPQSAAGGVSLPDSFAGELQVRGLGFRVLNPRLFANMAT